MNQHPRHDFDPVPSAARTVAVRVLDRDATDLTALPVLGVALPTDGTVPAVLGLDRDRLAELGCTGQVGQALVLPTAQRTLVAVGTGDAPSAAALRDAAAAFARAVRAEPAIATTLADVRAGAVEPVDAAQAVVEGILLARYRYDQLRSGPRAGGGGVEEIVLVVAGPDVAAALAGARRGTVLARAAAVARDLANTPAGHLTAPDLADVAVRLGAASGLQVQVLDRAALEELGCGGLLGVNAGSAVGPRMIRLDYAPAGAPRGHLGLVGKGITYDSGGISLKPSNAMHAAMKMDMSGAGAILAAMTVLAELDAPVRVTAFLACTDNMPSGSATKLGDVLTTRSGRTIEVVNTDAEGRLVMADAIDLVNEAGVDAILDVATLTGAALLALGPLTAAVLGNDGDVLALVEEAAHRTDERVWRLPLDVRYRPWLDSTVADIKNLGGESAGAITAALFLREWVDGKPWAHLDIAGPMRSEADDSWRTAGATGFGARLLVEAVLGFATPR